MVFQSYQRAYITYSVQNAKVFVILLRILDLKPHAYFNNGSACEVLSDHLGCDGLLTRFDP